MKEGGISIESTRHQDAYNKLVNELNDKKKKLMQRNLNKKKSGVIPNDSRKKEENLGKSTSFFKQPKEMNKTKINSNRTILKEVQSASCQKNANLEASIHQPSL